MYASNNNEWGSLMRKVDADVIVVGAGICGAHVATELAKLGLDVLLLDRQPIGHAGARWKNGIPLRMFAHANRGPGVAADLSHVVKGVVLGVGEDAPHRIRVDGPALVEANMALLIAEAQKVYENTSGRQILWETSVKNVELDRCETPNGLVLHDSQRRVFSLKAKLFVDASGMAAVLRKRSPYLAARCPQPDAHDICVAAQRSFAIKSQDRARVWMESVGTAPGIKFNRVAVAGGYSLLAVVVSEDLTEVSILAGALAEKGRPSGEMILRSFVRAQSWVGEELQGGASAIPLRQPYTHLVGPNIALVGDAACQVFSAHGSGVGLGLVAGKMLAESVKKAMARGDDIGSLRSLAHYSANFHRRMGGPVNLSVAFRRFGQKLEFHETRSLIQYGLMTESMLLCALEQRRTEFSPSDIARLFRGGRHAPQILKKLAPVLMRMPLIDALSSRYPRSQNVQALDRYDWIMQRLVA